MERVADGVIERLMVAGSWRGCLCVCVEGYWTGVTT
jgi:hypothetical protein